VRPVKVKDVLLSHSLLLSVKCQLSSSASSIIMFLIV
jgi:hypothetical protein